MKLNPNALPVETTGKGPKVDQADIEKLKKLFLEIIAEKTGYPEEIITPTMDLEADLGIDSIKRVEIFMTMREKVPQLPEVPLQDLAGLHTIEQIVRFMSELGEYFAASGPSPNIEALHLPSMEETRVNMAKGPVETSPFAKPTEISKEKDVPAAAFPAPPIPSPIADSIPEHFLPDPRSAHLPVKMHRYGLKPKAYSQTSSVPLAPDRNVIVLDAGSNLAEAVAGALQARGIPAVARGGEEQLFPQEPCGGIVYLGGLRPVPHLYAGVKLNKEAFRIAKASGPALQSAIAAGGGWWITVQDTGGKFGLEGTSSLEALRGGLAGLTKTLAQEWKDLYAKAIDISTTGADPHSLAKQIVDEILKGGEAKEVGLPTEAQRITLSMEEQAYSPGEKPWLDENSVLVVSGGARGITAAGVLALARAFKPKIVLFGRSPVLTQEPKEIEGIQDEKEIKRTLWEMAQGNGGNTTISHIDDQVRRILQSREIRQSIKELNEAGSPVKYYAVDILESRLIRTEGPSWTWKAGSLVRAALAEVRQEWGPIHGLIHGAGVVQDKLIQDKTSEQFDLVFDTKVLGLTELLSALEQDPLRVIILYSSIAARFGNRGQCDYAMANEVLNKIAEAEQAKRGESCLVKALDWGPWEGGMVHPALQALLKKAGAPLISRNEGTKALVEEVREGLPHIVEVVLRAEREKPSHRGKGGSKPSELRTQEFLENIQILQNAQGKPTLQASRLFDPEADTWLQDHCPTFVIPTMPLTGMMAVMRETAQKLFPQAKVIGFERFRASHWLEFSSGPQEIQILAETESAAKDPITVKVVLKQFREAPRAELSRWEPFCVGQVLMASEFPASPEGPRFIREKCLREFSGQELYQGGYRFHGPKFQKLLKMVLHPQIKGTTFIETVGRDKMASPLAWTLFMDAVAQSIPHEESLPWMEKTQGRVGFPLGVEQVQFFRDWPEASHLRCEFELLGIEQEGRLPKFEIRVYDGEGERAPLWAQLLWHEVLIDLGQLAEISPQDRVRFLRDRQPFPQWSLSNPQSSQTSLISLKDLKSYDWLPGTMAQVYLNPIELKEYQSLKAEAAQYWLAPRIAAKEWVAKLESIHPASVQVMESGENSFRAISERRPLNQIPFRWDFNGIVFRVEQNGPDRPWMTPIYSYFSQALNVELPTIAKLVGGIGEKFGREVVLADPEDYNRLRGKPVLYLGNHQTFIESAITMICLHVIGQIPVVALAKQEHVGLWVGKLDQLIATYPGLSGGSRTLYIDRNNASELLQTFSQLKNDVLDKNNSLLVHAEGKRSRRANQPIKKISNVLIDLSIQAGVPILPMRFRGGLPLQDADPKCDFPVGYGRQSLWIGRSMAPADLEALPYAQRATYICDAINQLGGEDNEFPEPADEVFGDEVKAWREYCGAEEASAVIFQALRRYSTLPNIPERMGVHQILDPWDRFILAGNLGQKLRQPTALILPDDEIGHWIQKLARWVFASNGPKIFLGEEPDSSFKIIVRGTHD
jgi:NAD(P)-dependent dehydrogenase (short-subunit alcohol dehydrogenase family)/1-acyl-sn-glycerol-3-phosphate acyltransferase/acyl carrier protein